MNLNLPFEIEPFYLPRARPQHRLRESEKSRRAAYRRSVRASIKKMSRIDRNVSGNILSSLRDAQKKIMRDIRGIDPDRFIAFHLKNMRDSISSNMAQWESLSAQILNGGYVDAWNLGTDVMPQAWDAAELGFLPNITDISSDVLIAMQSTGAELITNISRQATTRMSSIVNFAVIGGQNPFEAARLMDEVLGLKNKTGISARADTIIRTEMNRTFSIANEGRIKQFAKEEPLIKKEWMTTFDGRQRDDHGTADGQKVDVDKPFIVGGFEMMSPHDLNAPAEQVINCRCREIPDLDDVIEAAEKEDSTFIKGG